MRHRQERQILDIERPTHSVRLHKREHRLFVKSHSILGCAECSEHAGVPRRQGAGRLGMFQGAAISDSRLAGTFCNRPACSTMRLRETVFQGLRHTKRRVLEAGTGPSIPLTSMAPRSRHSKRSPISRRVPAAMTTAPGSAKACSRAATLGVSPTTECSCAGPLPIRSPTTTCPVAIPTRSYNR